MKHVEAHAVIGKAGGLTVSEALAAGRPMIVTGAVPGNETLNAEFVVQGGAGIVAAPREVGPAVGAMRSMHALARLGRSARVLVVRHAAERVLDVRAARPARQRRRAARHRRCLTQTARG